jgi:GT2 family glycosyltransferase
MFLLDSGKIPQPYTIQKLLRYNLPIVAAPHPAQKGNETGPMVLDRDGKGAYVQHYPWTGMQGPDVVVGCGGMLLRRDVVEAVGPWHCEYNEQGLLIRSEDFDFCDRAHALGYEVWADFDLMQEHMP